jgi:hypothetical protein
VTASLDQKSKQSIAGKGKKWGFHTHTHLEESHDHQGQAERRDPADEALVQVPSHEHLLHNQVNLWKVGVLPRVPREELRGPYPVGLVERDVKLCPRHLVHYLDNWNLKDKKKRLASLEAKFWCN